MCTCAALTTGCQKSDPSSTKTPQSPDIQHPSEDSPSSHTSESGTIQSDEHRQTPKNSESDPEHADSSDQPSSHSIILDGEFDEWNEGDFANTGFADDRYIYLHFSPAGEPQTIQAAPHTTRIRIDADNAPSTGRPMNWMSLTTEIQQPQGVDLLIELSPLNEQGSIGIGSSVESYSGTNTSADSGRSVGHAALGFSFLPTYASTQYEARIDRLAQGSSMLAQAGPITIVIDQVNEQGKFLWSTTMQLDLPPISQPQELDLRIAEKPAQSARIMSTNVLYSSPLTNPEPFARVVDAIDPDVILYQEWFKTTRNNVQDWLHTHAGSSWTLHMPDEGAGVAIATKLPVITTYESTLPPSGVGRPARAVAALINTQAGELLAISVHLKCCGSAGSEEDIKRIEQAQAINAFVDSVHANHPDAKVVIAGDFNLVGSRTPLEILAESLAADGSDLSPLNALQIGNASTVTWNDEKSRFSPGRLDWLLFDQSTTSAQNGFILDTRALSDSSLNAIGLHRDDSKASDHLPIVVDLVHQD